MTPNLPSQPLQAIAIDLMGPLPKGQRGAQYILAILDIFSKYIKFYAIKKATTKTILCKLINHYIPAVGKIITILADNGTQFHNQK